MAKPFKIDRNKNQNRSIGKAQNLEKESQYAKSLTKIQVTDILHKQDKRRNVLPKFIEICKKTPCWYPAGNQHKHPLLSFATEACIYQKH